MSFEWVNLIDHPTFRERQMAWLQGVSHWNCHDFDGNYSYEAAFRASVLEKTMLPSENSRAAKWQNTNGGVSVACEGGLCALAVGHLCFYFHSLIFHRKKAKEVSEGDKGDRVAKTVLPKDPCTPGLLYSRAGVMWLWPVTGSDVDCVLDEAVKSGYVFSISLLLPTGTLATTCSWWQSYKIGRITWTPLGLAWAKN